MIVVGLTGGMGQGKSTVGEILRQLAEVDYKADLEASYPISEVANAWIATWPKPLDMAAGQSLVDLANELIVKFPPILEQITGKSAEVSRLVIDPYDPQSLALHNRLLRYLDHWVLLSDKEATAQLPTPITPDNKGLHRALLMWIGGVSVEVVSPTIWSDLLDRRIKQLADRGYKLVTVGGIRYDHDADMIHANDGTVLKVSRPNSAKSSDITETAMKDIIPDSVLYNDGSLAQLEAVTQKLWRDLEAHTPKAEYHASAS